MDSQDIAVLGRAIGWLDDGSGAVTFAYAAPGDTNIDGQVDILDAANFAARIGVSTEELSQFEQDPVDFDLPFIRAYAHGLGVEIVHYVQEFRAPDAAAQFALMEAQYSHLDRAKALLGSKPSR